MAFLGRFEHPHFALYAPGYTAVTTTLESVQSPFTNKTDIRRIALHHYVTKSREDYEARMRRGAVMNDGTKGEEFWEAVEHR